MAIAGALSGARLLASINSQLGCVGYVIAVEYVFYAFFTLCLLCIISVLTAERLRGVKRESGALIVESAIRYVFLAAVLGTVATAWLVTSRW